MKDINRIKVWLQAFSYRIRPRESISVIEQEASFVEHMLGRTLGNGAKDDADRVDATRQLMTDTGRVEYFRRGDRSYSANLTDLDEIWHATQVQIQLKFLLETRPPDFTDILETKMSEWSKESQTPGSKEGYIQIVDFLGGGHERG